MSIQSLNLYLSENDEIYSGVPNWINFAFGLGAFLFDEGYKNKRSVKIIVTLPNETYFALFAAVGIADKMYSTRRQRGSIRKQIMNLKPNSRIIYHGGGVSRTVSVLKLEISPYNPEEMLLFVQDGKVKSGIPERQWFDNITILDGEFEKVKRTRKINDNLKVGITSDLLNTLYSQDQLNKTAFYPGDEFYYIGEKIQTTDILEETCFAVDGTLGSIADFLYFGNFTTNSSYTNGKFFSSYQKQQITNIENNIPILYSNAISYRKQCKHFESNPSLITIGRSDHDERIQEVATESIRRIIQNDSQLVTEEVVRYLENYGSFIPMGIEMLAWREK